ncbi:unnamed protein product, partial [Allacma fusca]
MRVKQNLNNTTREFSEEVPETCVQLANNSTESLRDRVNAVRRQRRNGISEIVNENNRRVREVH